MVFLCERKRCSRFLWYPCLFLRPPFPGLAFSLGGSPCLSCCLPCVPLASRWVASFFLFFVGCSRGCFFSLLPFSFSSLLCRLVSACRCVPPRLVCFFSLCPCLGLWFCGSAVVSCWSFFSGSCVGVGCLSPFCSFFRCACLPRCPFWLVSFAVVLRRCSCLCSRSCCVSLPVVSSP
jgi:hypothetical protein